MTTYIAYSMLTCSMGNFFLHLILVHSDWNKADYFTGNFTHRGLIFQNLSLCPRKHVVIDCM